MHWTCDRVPRTMRVEAAGGKESREKRKKDTLATARKHACLGPGCDGGRRACRGGRRGEFNRSLVWREREIVFQKERAMHTASIVVDMRNVRCGNCKISLQDEMATTCPVCGAPFDRVTSNHVGLASKLERRREEAGVAACAVNDPNSEEDPPELVSS
jgi:hypothetical protein